MIVNKNIQTFGKKVTNEIKFSLNNVHKFSNQREDSQIQIYVSNECGDLIEINEDGSYSISSIFGGVFCCFYPNSSNNFGIVTEPLKLKRFNRNLGLEIQRMLLCFWVLLFHSIKHSDWAILDYILHLKFHVPCFFFYHFIIFFLF